MFKTLLRYTVILFFILVFVGMGGVLVVGMMYYTRIVADLPRITKISDYRPKAVTQILAADGSLIGEVFEERRYPVSFEQIPKLVRDAFLAAEDANFYQHPGIDFVSIVRAVVKNLEHKQSAQGASTITQQVVKSLVLSREKTYERKAKEAILAYRLEKELSKNDILTIYLNQVFLGSNAYGVKAAARVHFHKELDELTVAEAAFLAGLPQRPSVLVDPHNRHIARQRQNYVLNQMKNNNMISTDQFNEALRADVTIYPPEDTRIVNAPYYSDHARKILEEYLAQNDPNQSATNPGGLIVRTSCDLRATEIATQALQMGLREVDKRRGWRGVIKEPKGLSLSEKLTEKTLRSGVIYRARVDAVDVKKKLLEVTVGSVKGLVSLDGVNWCKRYLQGFGGFPVVEKVTSVKTEQMIKADDWIEVSLKAPADFPKLPSGHTGLSPSFESQVDAQGRVLFQLDQTPEIEGAIVLASPLNGEVKVIVGGYDYKRSVFNRATQGLRQPGSSFKPIIYATAVELKDLTPSTMVPDSPISLKAGNGQMWTPQNYDHTFLGPITLRTALQKSRNVVSVYLLRKVGVERVVDAAKRFGLTTPIAPELSISLGTAEVRLLELTRAYGVFPASGWLLDSIVVRSVEDRDGKVLWQNRPGYREVISEETAFLMAYMMKGVVDRGTATIVKALNRPVAGKTGTTSEQMDAWFIGYTPDWVSGVWVGFDEKRNIGKMETGGKVAAPVFLALMQKFLEGTPVTDFLIPDGVVPVTVNLDSGRPTSGEEARAFYEYFKSGTEPLSSPAEADPSNNFSRQLDYFSSEDF